MLIHIQGILPELEYDEFSSLNFRILGSSPFLRLGLPVLISHLLRVFKIVFNKSLNIERPTLLSSAYTDMG